MKQAIAALALLTGGSAVAGVGDLHLQPCQDQKLQPAKCGTYTVWENRAAKAGRTIDLYVVVLQATGPNRLPDPLFILLGGPGEAAASAGPDWYLDDPARASRDLVFVDARGTGKSNGLPCRIAKDAPLQAFMPTLDVDLMKACRPQLEQHADLRYYLTTYAMDDLDDVRAALGYDKINLDAGSYGTGAALVYIRQHGEHVRAATLWATTALSQPMPLLSATDTEGALRNVFRDCYAEAACKAAFPTLAADYKRAVERIESSPVRVTVSDPRNHKPTDVTLGADAFAESLRAMLYKPESMRSIPLLLHKAAGGDYTVFADFQLSRNIALADAIADGLYFSITCTEDIDRSDPQQVHLNGRGTFLADHRARPHTQACKGWPRGQLPPAFGDEVKSNVPVLMVNGDNDPATPPSAGRAAMSRLSNARMIVVPYGGHSSEGLIGEECVKAIAARFLASADQRSLDTTCLQAVKHKPFILKSVGDLHLQPCSDKKVKQPSKCGTYTVWENRAAKTGSTIDLNVRVLQATASNPKPDPVFVLLGGPGEAATSAATYYGDDPSLADRDIVLVDARGTGKSNGLHCPIPKDGPLQGFMPTLNIPVIKACRLELEQHADLRYYLTTYAMDDLDDLRAALGYDKINLDGGSYGTRAALVYIRQHGDHVRTATLWGSTALTQPMPLHFATDSESALRKVFRDCYAEPACQAAFPNLEAEYKRTVERIENGPVRVTVKDPRNGNATEVKLEPDDFAESLRAMIYKPDAMIGIPLLLHKAAGGSYQAFADYQIGRNVELNEEIADGLYFSITCTEDIDRLDPQQVLANGRGTFLADHRARPHMEGCKGWPRGKLPAGFGEEVQSDVPVLIMVGDNDPATPPSAARDAVSRLSNGRVVVVPHGGHTFAGLLGEKCANGIAQRFLETADQRSLDVSCLKDVKLKPFVLE